MSSGQKDWADQQEVDYEARAAKKIRAKIQAVQDESDSGLLDRSRENDRLFEEVLSGAMFQPAAIDALRKLRERVV